MSISLLREAVDIFIFFLSTEQYVWVSSDFSGTEWFCVWLATLHTLWIFISISSITSHFSTRSCRAFWLRLPIKLWSARIVWRACLCNWSLLPTLDLLPSILLVSFHLILFGWELPLISDPLSESDFINFSIVEKPKILSGIALHPVSIIYDRPQALRYSFKRCFYWDSN